MCRTSLTHAAVIVAALFLSDRESEGGVALGQQPGHLAFFDGVDRSVKMFLDDFVIQTSTDVLSGLLPSTKAPMHVTPEQEKAFRGAADTLDEFLSGWRQSESLTPEQKKALEDATRVINEMTLSPAYEPMYIPEEGPPLPEPTLPPQIEVEVGKTAGKFGPFHYTLPDGWTATLMDGGDAGPLLRVTKGGESFIFGPIHPSFAMRGYEYSTRGFIDSSLAQYIKRVGAGPTTVLSYEPGSSMGNTTVGKQKIPAMWGKEKSGKTIVAFEYGGVVYAGSWADGETQRAQNEFLASLDLEKPLPAPSPPRPEYVPSPVHQESGPSSDFLTERGKDFFTALAHLASESGAHGLAVSSDLMKLCLEYPDLRDSALEAWEATLLALQGGSFEDMDRALLQFEYNIARTVGGMVGAKGGAPFGPTPVGATVSVLSARGTTWVFEQYVDVFHWWTDEWGNLGEALVPMYLQGFETYTDFWGRKGEKFGAWVRSW